MKTNINFCAILVLSFFIISWVGFSTVSEANENLFSDFREALKAEDNELAKQIIEKFDEINVEQDRYGSSLLIIASAYRVLEVTELLLANGANIHTRDAFGNTPLHVVSSGEVAELLVTNGADIHVKNNYGKTPLHYASSVEIAELLLTNGADVNTKDYDGNTPLHGASDARRVEVAELLLANGADIHAKNNGGNSPLHVVSNDLVDKLFLINPLYRDIHLYRVLSGEVAELLLANGADVNTKDYDGNTPLHWTSFNGHVEVTELLLANGADINTRNDKGNTPLDRANEGLTQKRYLAHSPTYSYNIQMRSYNILIIIDIFSANGAECNTTC